MFDYGAVLQSIVKCPCFRFKLRIAEAVSVVVLCTMYTSNVNVNLKKGCHKGTQQMTKKIWLTFVLHVILSTAYCR